MYNVHWFNLGNKYSYKYLKCFLVIYIPSDTSSQLSNSKVRRPMLLSRDVQENHNRKILLTSYINSMFVSHSVFNIFLIHYTVKKLSFPRSYTIRKVKFSNNSVMHGRKNKLSRVDILNGASELVWLSSERGC